MAGALPQPVSLLPLMNTPTRSSTTRRRTAWLIGVAMAAAARGAAQAPADSQTLAAIRHEGLERSRVMETAMMLSDIYGPRLAGSPEYAAAARWARGQLETWGLSKAALEPWGRRGSGWSLERFSAEMTAPHYLRLTAFPRAWSPALNGTVSGNAVLITARTDSELAKYHGTLRGAIVMVGSASPPAGASRTGPTFHRFTDAELDSMSRITDPGEPHDYWEDFDPWESGLKSRLKREEFWRAEGVAALLEPGGSNGALRSSGYNAYATDHRNAVPAFAVAREHYDRMVHLIEHGMPVRVELSLRTRFTDDDSLGYDVVAELPGTDPAHAEEVVMLGGHFDSWHHGTGATDNGAGSAVAMEAMRILKAIGARPRRTIRMALWDGEEQEDYFGSLGYVKRHFGDPVTMTLRPEHAKLSAYFNLDNGTGKIRGIYLRGNAAARPVFAGMLAPLKDLGASTLTIANEGSTDHMAFVSVGLPGFEFIQDPLDYGPRTHHTSLDVADYLSEDDLKQAAVVMASVVYQTAMRDELIPRPPLPAPRPRKP
jgi:carboxypeptidase Q